MPLTTSPTAAVTAALALAATAGIAGVPNGLWPVDDPRVTSGFRPPAHSWEHGHRGVDLAASTGDEVRAVMPGVVTVAGTIAGKPVVAVALPGDSRSRVTYEPVVARLRVGTEVRAGEVLGVLAATGGHCGGTAGCLHLGLRTPTGYRDPLTLIERVPAVLKPG